MVLRVRAFRLPSCVQSRGARHQAIRWPGQKAAQNRPEQPVAQNKKVMERLTKASPARPVAARIETDWITDNSSTAKT